MKHRIMIIAGVLLLWGQQLLFAQEEKEDDSKTDEYAELIKDARHSAGFIDSYQADGKLYLAITSDMLGREFLMKYEISRGIGSSGLYGGTMLNIFEGSLVSLEKHEGKIFLIQKPHRYVAGENTPEQKAVELTFGNSVLETAEIEAVNEDSVMLIEAYDWFVSDLSQISDRVEYAVSSTPGRPGRATLDKDRSYLKEVKAFPKNTNISVMLTFENSEENAPRTVADGRYIPVGIHYTLAALPEQPMTRRIGDDRVGFFMTVHKNFTNDNKSTFFNRFVNKWRLECKEKAAGGELCEPEQPIIYYVDRTVPKRYRKAMIAGVDAWAKAFEAAGFKNAIRGELLPEEADPEDIRYATLRWNTSDEPGYGAIGPSVVDPRTGEILDADILFEANMLLGFKNTWRSMVNPKTALENTFGFSKRELNNLKQGAEFSNLAATFSDQGMLLRSALVARDEIDPNAPVPDKYVNEALKWVTMHEVGHSLGLRHNFRSSIDTPLQKLYDKEWTKRYGVFSSVMDYPTINLPPEGMEMGYFYNPEVGSYDRWAISYGYVPDAEKAKVIARQSAQKGHAYGTDEDAGGPGAIDPTVNVFDLSADPMAWGRQRADIIREMIPKLPEIALADNEAYYRVTDLFQSALGQYAQAVATGIKYVGGQYQYRDHMGDPNGRPPFLVVNQQKQREALNFVIEYIFSEKAMIISPDVYRKFGADRWSHWGNTTTYSGRVDYPLHETILGVQTAFLDQLTDAGRLAKIRDAELKFGVGNVLTIPELMGQLQTAIWGEVEKAPGRNISSNRRDLQRAHLNRMITLLTGAPDEIPADARSVVRMQLMSLQSQLKNRLAPPAFAFDEYTRAHLEESKTRIERALAAGFELKN